MRSSRRVGTRAASLGMFGVLVVGSVASACNGAVASATDGSSSSSSASGGTPGSSGSGSDPYDPGPAPDAGLDPTPDGASAGPRHIGVGGGTVNVIAVGDDFLAVNTTSGYASYAQTLHVIDKASGAERSATMLGGIAKTPWLGAEGPDLAYAVRASGLGSDTPEVVGCSGAVCGSQLLTTIPFALGLHEGRAYWRDGTNLVRCSLAGCTGAPEAFATVPDDTGRVVFDGASAYLLRAGSVDTLDAAAPGGSTPLFTIGGGALLEITATRVLVATSSAIVGCARSGCATGAATLLETPGILDFVADDQRILWLASGRVRSCTITGSTCVPATGDLDLSVGPATGAIAQDRTHFYVASGSNVDVYVK